jgi:hypothetical protein
MSGEAFSSLPGRACRPGSRAPRRVHDIHRDSQLPERIPNLLRLALPHQPVVDENDLEPVADGAVRQHRAGRAVHSSREGRDGPFVADHPFDVGDFFFYKFSDFHAFSPLSLVGVNHSTKKGDTEWNSDSGRPSSQKVREKRRKFIPDFTRRGD